MPILGKSYSYVASSHFILKKQRARTKPIIRRPTDPDQIFSKEWKEGVKKQLAEWKSSSDSMDKNIAKVFEAALVHKIIAEVSLTYAPQDLYGRIVSDAECICNEIGASLLNDEEEVSRCMTRKHRDCKGAYVHTNPDIKRKIICRCKCHERASSTA